MLQRASSSCSSSGFGKLGNSWGGNLELYARFSEQGSSDPPRVPKVEYEHEEEEEEEDELSIRSVASPKDGLCCLRRRPLFRGAVREKAYIVFGSVTRTLSGVIRKFIFRSLSGEAAVNSALFSFCELSTP